MALKSLKFLLVVTLGLLLNQAAAQCPTGQGEVYIRINTSSYGNEVFWKIVDGNGQTVDSVVAGVYASNQQYVDTLCLGLDTNYTFQAWDQWGDGWSGATYAVQFGNKTIINNGGNAPTNSNNSNGNAEIEVSENFRLTVDTFPDISVLEVLSPKVSTCSGNSFPIGASLQVMDSNTIDTVTLYHKIGSNSAVSQQFVFNPPLAKDSVVHLQFSNQVSLSSAGSYNIAIWAAVRLDDNPGNDTAKSRFLHDSAKTVFPISLNFDATNNCGAASSTCITNGSCDLNTIWVNAEDDDLDWSLGSGTTNSLGTGPKVDQSAGNSTGKYLFLESSGCQGSEAHFQLNCVELNRTSNPFLEFWYHMYGNNMGNLYVEIDTNGTWITLDSLKGQQQSNSTSDWKLRRVDLRQFKTKANIRLRGVVGNGFTSDMAIDAIGIRDIPRELVITRELLKPADSTCGDSNLTVGVVISNEGLDDMSNFYVWLASFNSSLVNRALLYRDTLSFQETDTLLFTGLDAANGVNTTLRSIVAYSGWGQSPFHQTFTPTFYYPFPQNPSIADTGKCGAGSLTLSGTTNMGDTLDWFSDRQGTQLLQTGDVWISPNLTRDTILYYRARSLNGNCSAAMDSVQIFINSNLSSQLQVQTPGSFRPGNVSSNLPDSIAQGDSVVYTLAVPSGYQLSQYGQRWSASVQIQSSGGAAAVDTHFEASTSQMPQLTLKGSLANADSTYHITFNLRDLQSGCDTLFGRRLFIMPAPEVSYGFTTVCAGDTTQFYDSSSIVSGALQYQWNFGDGSTSKLQEPKHQYTSAGSYQVMLKLTSTLGVVDSLIKQVEVHALPNADFTNAGVCAYDTATLLNRSSVSAGSRQYEWTLGNGDTTLQTDVRHRYDTSGQYTVQLVATSNKGCRDTAQKLLNIYAVPTAHFGVAAVCLEDSARFADSSSLVQQYTWLLGNGDTATTASPSLLYDTAGTYNITLIGASANGCLDTTQNQLEVYPMPQWQMRVNNVCAYDSVRVIDQSINAATYQWIWGTGDTTTSTTGKYLYPDTGAYQIEATITTTNGCQATDSLSVRVYEVPSAGFTATTVCNQDTTTFSNQSSITTGFISSRWLFGDGTTSNQISPQHLYDTAGNYAVSLITRSVNGCRDTATKTVMVHPNPQAGFSFMGQCSGDTTFFQSTSTGAASQVWDFSNGDSSRQTNPAYAFTNAGTYQVWLYARSNQGCEDSISQNVQVFQSPAASFSASNSCEGDTVSFANFSTNASQLLWYFGNGDTSSLTSPSVVYNARGQYQVKLVTTGAGNCQDSSSTNITVFQSSQSKFSLQDVCLGDTAIFQDSSTNAQSYAWSFGNGLTSNLASPKLLYTSAGTYQVQLITSTVNNCIDTAARSIEVYPLPSVQFGNPSAICVGDTLKPGNSSSGATHFQWTFGTGDTLLVSSPNYVFDTNGVFNIQLLATTNRGCKAIDSNDIRVDATPEVAFTASGVCDNQSMRFTNQSRIASGSMSYAWDFGDGSGSSALTSPSYSYGNDGVYQVKLIATSNRGCQDSITESDTVYALPAPDFSAQAVCLNDSTVFNNNSSNAVSHFWQFGDGNTSTDAKPEHLYTSAGSYTVKLISTSDKGCVDSVAKNITVYSLPVASFSAQNNCLNDTTSFSNNSANATSYAWTFSDGNTSTASNPVHLYDSIGQKPIQLIATSSNGCKDTTTGQVEVYRLPVAAFTANDTCFGDTTYFHNQSQFATSYAWTFGNNASSTVASPKVRYANSGNYGVRLITRSTNNCRDTMDKTVEVFAIPQVAFNQVSTICQFDSFSISNSTSGANQYLWTFGNGDSSTASAPNYAFDSAATYTITQRAGNANGCFVEGTSTITVHPEPEVAFNANGVCDNQSMRFTNQSSIASGSMSYAWDFGDGSGSSALTSPSYNYRNDGVYQVKLIATSNRGCQDSITESDTVYALPAPDFSAQAVCLNDSTVFSNNSSNAVSHFWQFGDGNTSTDAKPKHLYTSAGSYTVKLISTSDKGCVDSVAKNITVYSLPVASFSAQNNCLNDTTSFSNNSANATSYAWTFGDGNTSTASNPVHLYDSIGQKPIQLIATSSNGCKDTTTGQVEVYRLPVAAFTANDTCFGDTTYFHNQSQFATSYAWTFGNSDSSMATSPKVQYGAVGSYTISLIAKTQNACLDTATMNKKVYALPKASFSVNDVCLGDTTVFQNNSTGASQYQWHFGNGFDTTVSQFSFGYPGASVNTVKLVAISQEGCRDSLYDTASVYRNPVANFRVNDVCLDDTAHFNNTAQLAQQVLWYFGDSDSSTSINPSHFYKSSGNYAVRQVAYSPNGCRDTALRSLTIKAIPNIAFSADSVICQYDSLAVQNSTSGASGYAWQFGHLSTSTDSIPKLTLNQFGTFKVKLTATSSANCKVFDSTYVRVKPSPTAGHSVQNVCLNDTTFFQNQSTIGKGNMRYRWDFGDNLGFSTRRNPAYIRSQDGIYTSKLVVTSAEGCMDSSFASDTIFALPQIAFAADTACFSDSTNFTNQSTGAAQWQWQIAGQQSTVAQPRFLLSGAGSFVAQLKATSAKGCVDSLSQTVVVNALPSINFSTANNCLQDTTHFTNFSTNSQRFLWQFGDGTTSTGTSPNHVYTNSGNYSVQLWAEAANGCTDSLQKQMSVFALPNAAFTANDTCLDDTTYFNNQSTNAQRYEWQFGDGIGSKLQSPRHQYRLVGGYTAQLVAYTNRGCSDTAQQRIAIHQNPLAQFTVADVCVHDTAEFTNSSVGANRYQWHLGNGQRDTNRHTTLRYQNAGNYNTKLVATSAQGCKDSMLRTLSVFAAPRARFSANNACDGDSTRFNNTSVGAVAYQWDFGNTTSGILPNPKVRYADTGKYAVQLIARSLEACVDTLTLTTTVLPRPKPQFSLSPNCVGDTSFFVNNTPGINRYLWRFAGGITDTAKNTSFIFNRPDTVSITLRAEALNGCVAVAERKQVVGAYPTVQFDSTAACAGELLAFPNKSIEVGDTTNYLWRFGFRNRTSTQRSTQFRYPISGIYRVSLKATTNIGCTDSTVRQIRIFPAPQASFSHDLACVDQATTLFTTTVDTSIEHQWIIGNDSLKGDTVLYTFANAGPQTVTLQVAQEAGCGSNLSKTVDVGQLPLARFVADLQACAEEPVDFLDLSTIEGREKLQYRWDFGDGRQDSIQDPVAQFDSAGDYRVRQLVSTAKGCTDTFERMLSIDPLPAIDIDYRVAGAYVYFNPGDTALASYLWDFGNGTTSRFPSPRNWYDENGRYVVRLEAENEEGCNADREVVITMTTTSSEQVAEGEVAVYPNPFTQVLHIEATETALEGGQVALINQEGVVLRSQMWSNQFSGSLTWNTANLPSGVYFLRFTQADGSQQIQKVVKMK